MACRFSADGPPLNILTSPPTAPPTTAPTGPPTAPPTTAPVATFFNVLPLSPFPMMSFFLPGRLPPGGNHCADLRWLTIAVLTLFSAPHGSSWLFPAEIEVLIETPS
ncbi:hypothetical protein D5S19_05735 [Amycolatopsis panacis]|uniref:Uncharacterized protein n=1 Tax=Amycolatopsis panacis TaxID=2340917 RepID=A0A419I8X2_9PSEU|nr:hypothetical protein D5S19_05735 [Amycolatopsis panacis]